MTEAKYQEFKEYHIEYIKNFIKNYGQIGAVITVAGTKVPGSFFLEDKENENNDVIIQIPVPPKFLENGENKEVFTEEVLPEIFSELKKSMIPDCVVWTAEAWVRKATTEEYEKASDYTELPITDEIIIISFERENDKEIIFYKLKCDGKIVNKDGDLIDAIELIEDEELSKDCKDYKNSKGRFSDLFSKFNL